MKKRLLALMLVVAMVMGMSMTTFAEGNNTNDVTANGTSDWVSEASTAGFTLNKIYAVTGADNASKDTLYPAETLYFKVNADNANPDATKLITVAPLVVNGQKNQTTTISLPVYDKVGVYKYTISEDTSKIIPSQGVVYTSSSIAVTVLVDYNYDAAKLDTEIVLSTVKKDNENNDITGEDGKTVKEDTFTNTYNVGTLTVEKTISGNLASNDTYFDIDVTFNSENAVTSAITVTGGSNNDNPTTIAKESWKSVTSGDSITGYTTKTTIKLKANDTITFTNIPNGVTYSVEEQSKHGVGDDGFNANSSDDTDYTITYKVTDDDNEVEGSTGTVNTDKTDSVVVNNEKSTSIDTGIILNNMPYILALIVVAFAAVVLFRRKREF